MVHFLARSVAIAFAISAITFGAAGAQPAQKPFETTVGQAGKYVV